MADSATDAEDEQSHIKNYDNCIVTAMSESSDSDSTIETGENNTESIEEDAFLSLHENVLSMDLSSADTFLFMLGTLDQIDTYISDLVNVEKKTWLQDNIKCLTDILIKNSHLFKTNIKYVDGELCISDLSHKKSKKLKTYKKADLKKNNLNKDKLNGVMEKKEDNVDHEISDNKNENVVNSIRQSERIQKIYEKNDVVYCDRMEYLAFKLLADSSTPLPKGLIKKKDSSSSRIRKQQPRLKPKTPKRSPNEHVSKRLKPETPNHSLNEQVSNFRVTRSTRPRTAPLKKDGHNQSLPAQLHAENNSKPTRKRQSTSASGRSAKKFKVKTESNVEQNSSYGEKRKLYTAEDWLNELRLKD